MKGKIINGKYRVVDSVLVAKKFSNWIQGSCDQISAINVTMYLCVDINTNEAKMIDPIEINTITEDGK